MANTLNKVNSGGIEDGSIVNADIKSDAAIAKSKLAALDLVNADIDVITLTTGADEFEACKELVRKFNEGPHSDGALVVADDVAGTYCSSTITGVSIA